MSEDVKTIAFFVCVFLVTILVVPWFIGLAGKYFYFVFDILLKK